MYIYINIMNNNLLKLDTNTVNENIWYKDLRILYINNNYIKFFPTANMNNIEKLNSIVRTSIIISTILILYTGDINFIFLAIFVLLITYLIHTNNTNISNYNNYTEKKVEYVLPTVDNPFMNITLNDYIENPNREALIKKNNYKNPKLDNLINKSFNFNLYKDFSDIFNKNNSQRQFYTTPVTTIPNNQKSFGNWLYKTSETCKERTGAQCYNNIYTQLKYA